MEMGNATRDFIKYRVFQVRLASSATSWYRQLKRALILSYKKLRKAFINQFFAHHDSERPSTHLLTLKQRERESLREYVSRCKEENIKVADCSDDTVSSTFIAGLADPLFKKSIGRNPMTLY